MRHRAEPSLVFFLLSLAELEKKKFSSYLRPLCLKPLQVYLGLCACTSHRSHSKWLRVKAECQCQPHLRCPCVNSVLLDKHPWQDAPSGLSWSAVPYCSVLVDSVKAIMLCCFDVSCRLSSGDAMKLPRRPVTARANPR